MTNAPAGEKISIERRIAELGRQLRRQKNPDTARAREIHAAIIRLRRQASKI